MKSNVVQHQTDISADIKLSEGLLHSARGEMSSTLARSLWSMTITCNVFLGCNPLSINVY